MKRKTVGKRMTAKLREVLAQLRRRMNDPIEQTGSWLTQVVRGYFNYHAVPGIGGGFMRSDGKQPATGCLCCDAAASAAVGGVSVSRS